MVKTFGYSEEDKGTYVGLVASSVFAGRAVGSFFWGWLSDIKGRRLVLLCTIFGNGVFSFTFGFADTLPMAMVLRFLSGLANGTVGTAKTILYDVSDNSNQAFSMSMISVAWGSGLILGPTLGGYLALPAEKYPSVFPPDSIFGRHPFILPSLCCFVVCAIVFTVVFFKFQEPEIIRNRNVEFEVSLADEGKKGAEQSPAVGQDVAEEPAEDKGPAGGPATADRLTVASEAIRSSVNPALHSSHPLLTKHKSESSHTTGQSRIRMSLENLHCETEILYYYARRESERLVDDDGLRLPRPSSRSLHALQTRYPRLFPSIEEISTPRKRSYSHGDQTKSPPIVSSVQDGAVTNTDSRLRSASAEVEIEMWEVGPASPCLTKEPSASKSWCPCCVRCYRAFKNSALVYLLGKSDVRHSVALYTVFSFAVIGYEDVFTIFASTSIEYDGLAFTTDEIGTALGAVSIPLMFIQLKLYPQLVKKFGIKRAFLICMFFIFIPVQLVPILHLLVYHKAWLWVGIILVTLPQRIATNSCFAGSSLLINNSVTAEMAGKVNGIGMTATAIARTLAPTLGGAMFSWSLKACQKYGSPLDVNITFVFFGFVLFISSLQCLFLPEHLDHQKK